MHEHTAVGLRDTPTPRGWNQPTTAQRPTQVNACQSITYFRSYTNPCTREQHIGQHILSPNKNLCRMCGNTLDDYSLIWTRMDFSSKPHDYITRASYTADIQKQSRYIPCLPFSTILFPRTNGGLKKRRKCKCRKYQNIYKCK